MAMQRNTMIELREVTMKKQGPILAVGLTVFLLLTVVIFRSLPAAAEPPAAGEGLTAKRNDARTAYAVTAKQVARHRQEAELLGQIAELDAELAGRQATYHQRLEELSTLVVVGEEQLTLLQEEQSVLQERIDQLLVAQTLHAVNAQKRQHPNPNQFNIQHLQVQLDEGKISLQQALARLDSEER